ncbi:MAG TPA: YciI family protein [Terriglobia bacterium]
MDEKREVAPGRKLRIDMLFIVQFEDKPGTGELRQKLLEEHFAFLDSRKDKVLVAGSVRELPSDRPIGGLWIVEAENEAEVRDLFKDDPFWVNELRASVRINRWVKAFPDRKTPV